MKTAGTVAAVWALLAAVSVVAWAPSAHAFQVAGWSKGGFADFSKAIVFTGVACPQNAETIATSGGAKTCALPMRPVGDGSWTCTATIIKGTAYTYYFEYRIPKFDSSTVYTDSQKTYVWKNVPATGGRGQDASKGATVPTTATSGYVVYNIWGDATVRGAQGAPISGDSWLTAANPYVARYLGVTDIDASGNTDTGDLDGNNNYSMTATQTSDTTVQLSWKLDVGAADIVATVEGAREFDTQSTYAPYGFKVLRARITTAGGTTAIKNLIFEDTVVNKVTGETFYSPSRTTLGNGWYDGANTFSDTSIPADAAVGDTFIYVVLFHDAYGNQSDSSDQDFSGGNASFVRNGFVDVIFMVEKFDPSVVFPNGSTEGTLFLTPYVNGVPMPFNQIRAKAVIARRSAG